ncbi:hypothetical protein ACVW0K_007409 [Streptomyces filamentosus]
MTVQGETPAADVDLGAAAQQMTEVYQQHWERLCVFIWKRLDLWQRDVAQDLASESFAELWARYFLTGRTVDRPYGLLCTIARSQIGQHFLRKCNQERALDFADPVNTPILANGHAYGAETPELTLLTAELDAAMERMTAASQTWRDQHKETHRLRRLLADGHNASRGGLSPEAKQGLLSQLEVADRAEDQALLSFRDTCRTVGQLRGEMEVVAGPNWRSSTGLPQNPEITAPIKGKYRNDPSVTHCPAGHLLDLANTHFAADGSRDCRACRNTRYEARRDVGPKPKARATTSLQTLVDARALLVDPANAHLSIAAIAAMVGVTAATLHRRIPGLAELRRDAKAKAAELAGAR